MPIDKKENYYNFVHENPNAPITKHRLGEFRVFGRGQSEHIKNIGCLHVPQWDDKNIADKIDQSADALALYQTTRKDWASVHLYADTDSFILMLPGDYRCSGCANPITEQYSIEAEISGFMRYPKEHWLSETGRKKFVNTARAYIQLFQLQYGKDWKDFAIPAQIGKLQVDGSPEVPGFIQHRDVPLLSGGKWVQPPDSFKYGQHEDISPDFPIEYFLKIYEKELLK